MTETVSHPVVGGLPAPGRRRDDGPRRRPSTRWRSSTTTAARSSPARVGALHVRGRRGVSLFPEYLHDPEATARSFTHDGWFVTGDRVRLDARGHVEVRRAGQGRAQGRRGEHRRPGDRAGAARGRRGPRGGRRRAARPHARRGAGRVRDRGARCRALDRTDAGRALRGRCSPGSSGPGRCGSSTSCRGRPSTRSPRRGCASCSWPSRPMTERGPLAGITVVELAGIGPGPYCVMLLADMGATRRPRGPRRRPRRRDYTPNPVLERGRRSVAVDLKQPPRPRPRARPGGDRRRPRGELPARAWPSGWASARTTAWPRNPRLVYGRMSGWGQDGPLAGAAGHDINYISLTGALHAIGRAGERPVPPLNLVGDFGGGASSLAFGIVCALLEARTSGRGQVVDANVFDSTATLMGLIHGLRAQGRWSAERGDEPARHRLPLLRRLHLRGRPLGRRRGDRGAVLLARCSTSSGWARTRRSPAATRTGAAGRRSGRR